MKTVLLWLWQAPQHIMALLLWGVLWLFGWLAKPYASPLCSAVIIITSVPHFGLSLGEYVFIGAKDLVGKTIAHEHGHTIQSRCLGPLYIIVVGLLSICRNIYSRIKHKNATWYYSCFPEGCYGKHRWWEKFTADYLGGVLRM
jgi:hypothetical protein